MRHQRSPSATNKALSTNGHRPATPLLSSYREVPTLVISIPTRHTSSTPSQLHTIYSTTLPLASPLRDSSTSPGTRPAHRLSCTLSTPPHFPSLPRSGTQAHHE